MNRRRPDVHPAHWRYVLETTENFIKDEQPWFTNQKMAEKQQQQQQQQQQQGQQGQQQQGQQGQQQQASGSQADGDGGSGDPMDKYGVEKRMLYQNMREESEHIKRLKQYDGQGASPAKPTSPPSAIDEAEQFTPDNWVARSDEMIRLTGKHPMNAEPEMIKLYNSGFITPNYLHFTRNHGAVPRILWERHKLEVTAGKTISLSMDDLAEKFNAINIPVLLACDGNGRKELNMVRRSKGFNWGACAMACSYWKGALLRDILIAADVGKFVASRTSEKLWANFEGADELSEGKYATSVPLDYIMEDSHDVMVAYQMNDCPLPPDHGYPVRLLLPGFVGGRCVKWLAKIRITDYENDSYYHIYDNRVLPEFITGDQPEFAELMYHHPSTTINEQSLNSMILKPAQGEKIRLEDVAQGQIYRVEGIAYSGGGEEVERVETSLDGGQNWLYCTRTVSEYMHGVRAWY